MRTGAPLPEVPYFGLAERVALWPGASPRWPEPALALRVVERSPNPEKFHLRALSGGGHGFGLGNSGEPLSAWPALLLKWIAAGP